MERETATITTPKGNIKVVLKTYLTGAEKRFITNASMPQKVNYANGSESFNDIDLASMMNAAEDAILKSVIVSVNGVTETNFVDAILDMHSEDSEFVISEVKKIADGITEEKKTA